MTPFNMRNEKSCDATGRRDILLAAGARHKGSQALPKPRASGKAKNGGRNEPSRDTPRRIGKRPLATDNAYERFTRSQIRKTITKVLKLSFAPCGVTDFLDSPTHPQSSEVNRKTNLSESLTSVPWQGSRVTSRSIPRSTPCSQSLGSVRYSQRFLYPSRQPFRRTLDFAVIPHY
jgi:hypothetical protein